MSLHKIQIFVIISATLSIFTFLITSAAQTFAKEPLLNNRTISCSSSPGGTGTTVINGSAANVSSVNCITGPGSLIDAIVASAIVGLVSFGALAVLPFI